VNALEEYREWARGIGRGEPGDHLVRLVSLSTGTTLLCTCGWERECDSYQEAVEERRHHHETGR
jgi:hypothetical protein